MKTNVLVLTCSALLLSACMVTPNHRGGIDVVPILPVIVEVDDNSYYAHGGYHCYYNDDRWYYSETRDGRRSELPRSHWPRETHRHGWDRDRNR